MLTSIAKPPSCTLFSGPLEESSVRAIFALNQEKVLDDYLVSQGDANEDEIEEEYNQKCPYVVNVSIDIRILTVL